MKNNTQLLIKELDISIYNKIHTRVSDGEKRSLLAIQRSVKQAETNYAYAEIGSFNGGSIQPYLIDSYCTEILAIDPRPVEVADDRQENFIVIYPDNTTAKMMSNLQKISSSEVSKVLPIEQDASEINYKQYRQKYDIIFIDGEHTNKAVISDFNFSEKAVKDDGVIVFHDFRIIYKGIYKILENLKSHNKRFYPVKLEGTVFAIFFDKALIEDDPYLKKYNDMHKNFLTVFKLKQQIKSIVPVNIWNYFRTKYVARYGDY